jgi:hypothetical protein
MSSFRTVDHLVPQEICSVPVLELLEWNGAGRSEDLVELHSNQVACGLWMTQSRKSTGVNHGQPFQIDLGRKLEGKKGQRVFEILLI